MGIEYKETRRKFLVDSVKAVGLTAFFLKFPSLVSASPLYEEDESTLKLVRYLDSIRQDQERIAQIVARVDIFENIKNFSPEQRVDDLNRYFPIYRAADLKLNIPWSLLWIMHAAETAVSRDPNMNIPPHIGAMQVDPNYNLEESILGWEFLANLPNQRHPDDWKEIFRGAQYIRNGAEEIKRRSLETDEEAVLEIVRYGYSASRFGIPRANQYLKIKRVFD